MKSLLLGEQRDAYNYGPVFHHSHELRMNFKGTFHSIMKTSPPLFRRFAHSSANTIFLDSSSRLFASSSGHISKALSFSGKMSNFISLMRTNGMATS
mmetsp:Transcript_32825/g.60161  ORF Transcript_32825/g.60161 Transcript_32825/m.60161 type:complete len:97 (-) Transcript_32825:1460-1750(-)